MSKERGGVRPEANISNDESQIRDLVRSWMAASKAGDLPALLGLMTDDVVFMVPNSPPFGKAEFTAGAERMRGALIEGSAEIVEIELFGPRAMTRSRLELVLTPAGGSPRPLSGYAMSLLRKEADGRWRIARDANLVTPEDDRRHWAQGSASRKEN